jgi:hypothetical protein
VALRPDSGAPVSGQAAPGRHRRSMVTAGAAR